ncbi:MAG: DUF4783 domain-containing protein [Spirosomataceae bacterium]
MKWITSLLAVMILSVWICQAAPPDGGVGIKIKNSLKGGYAKELVSLFDKDIELVIDSEKVEFNKISISHAEQILKAFFKKHPPRDFQFVYQGAGATVRYSTGTYFTGTEAYLVYILLKKSGNQYLIGTIHFRKEQPPTAKR